MNETEICRFCLSNPCKCDIEKLKQVLIGLEKQIEDRKRDLVIIRSDGWIGQPPGEPKTKLEVRSSTPEMLKVDNPAEKFEVKNDPDGYHAPFGKKSHFDLRVDPVTGNVGIGSVTTNNPDFNPPQPVVNTTEGYMRYSDELKEWYLEDKPWPKKESVKTEPSYCTFIGDFAGADQLEGTGLVIIGDGIKSMPEGKRIIVGDTIFGQKCNLAQILRDAGYAGLTTKKEENGPLKP